MNRIICPVDFSEPANNALEYAANLAVHLKAQLTLLHIVQKNALHETPTGAKIIEATEELEKEAKRKLETCCEELKKEFTLDCFIRVKTHSEGLEKALSMELTEEGFDLAVMGTNGPDDYNQLFFGTHTYNVIRKINIPLLMVPKGCQFESFENMVYASDYDNEDMVTLQKLVDFANVFSSKITFLHISNHDTEKSEEIFLSFKDVYEDKLEAAPGTIFFEREINKDSTRGIDAYMDEKKADLLVLQVKHRTALQKIFHDSVIKKLSFAATYPVLINQN
ncbi:MAG: universal stress protein [Cyclobacteriaceae bacterium]